MVLLQAWGRWLVQAHEGLLPKHVPFGTASKTLVGCDGPAINVEHYTLGPSGRGAAMFRPVVTAPLYSKIRVGTLPGRYWANCSTFPEPSKE